MKNIYPIAALLLILIFAACGSIADGSGGILYRAGTYEGNGGGYFGLITVSVSVTENAVTEIEILSHSETEGIGTNAFEELSQMVMYTNSPDIDVIAGATGSSEGFITAVNDALSKARME